MRPELPTVVALTVAGCAGAPGAPGAAPAKGCAEPLIELTNRSRQPMAVSYQLSGPRGSRFLILYYNIQREHSGVIDSLPPVSPQPIFLGVVKSGPTVRLGPVPGLTAGEAPRVNLSVRVYDGGVGGPVKLSPGYMPRLVCPLPEVQPLHRR
jgi:hypothetical protein